MKRGVWSIVLAVTMMWFAAAPNAALAAPAKKPNIIVIWGDDIGINNISAYNLGVMGYKTPNIDRIAREGALFTDAYVPRMLEEAKESASGS